jgi:molybdate-binding protein/DNA-binding XRE family transcriptional regulator
MFSQSFAIGSLRGARLPMARSCHTKDTIMAYQAFVNRLKARRLERRWSQAEVAAKAGVSRTAVSAIEGSRLVPSVAAALALAAAFGCAVEDIFGPERKTANGPAWALAPPRTPCRYWQAKVGDRLLCYPSESADAGVVEHDGVFANGALQDRSALAPEQTLVMAGCDPAAGLLVQQLARTAGVRLLVLARSSRDALELLGKGLVHVAGIHLATAAAPHGNAQAVRAALESGYCLLRLAHWQEGLALAPHLGLRSPRAALDAKLRWIGREPGSGARQCQDELLGSRPAPRRLARNHRGVAESIRGGWADAGICLRLVGEEAGLRFFTVREEIFDLCYRADAARDPRIEALQKALRSAAYRRLLGDLPGYDASATGELQTLN